MESVPVRSCVKHLHIQVIYRGQGLRRFAHKCIPPVLFMSAYSCLKIFGKFVSDKYLTQKSLRQRLPEINFHKRNENINKYPLPSVYVLVGIFICM